MRINCLITPLTCVAEDNINFVKKAEKNLAEYIPKPSYYYVVQFNSKSTEMVGQTEVEVSSIEKIKCYSGELEVGKPAKVTIDFGSYIIDGKHGLTTKIVGTW